MNYGHRSPFAADRLYRPGDLDIAVTQQATLPDNRPNQQQKPRYPVEQRRARRAPSTEDLSFARDALQRVFM